MPKMDVPMRARESNITITFPIRTPAHFPLPSHLPPSPHLIVFSLSSV